MTDPFTNKAEEIIDNIYMSGREEEWAGHPLKGEPV